MNIIPATTPEQWAVIEGLAREILPEVYDRQVGPEVSRYLIEHYHTAAVLAGRFPDGVQPYLIRLDGKDVGYFALSCGGDDGVEGGAVADEDAGGEGKGGGGGESEEGVTMLLTKFYILPAFRGRGLGQGVMDFVETRARVEGVHRIRLAVLRTNVAAVGLYLKNGYIVYREVITHLGPEYGLEDYIMVKYMTDKQQVV
jgi:GNAT superfamily N-acetyltransferase